jgi:hypothetical protein
MSIAITESASPTGTSGHPHRRRSTWGERMARRRQRMVAVGFQRVLDDARRPPRGLTARVAVERDQVLDAAADVELLVARLRDVGHPVAEDPLAQAGELLRDGDGPVYRWAEPGTLRRRVRVICEAVE